MQRSEKLIYDDYAETFSDLPSMKEALEEIDRESRWVNGVETKSVEVHAIENFPLYADDFASRYGCNKDAIMDTMTSGICLLASFNGETYPLRNTGKRTLIDRAGLDCRVIYKYTPEEMESAFNTALRKWDGNTTVLIRGEKLTAAMSDNGGGYEQLPMSELIKIAENSLVERFGNRTIVFEKGWISHEIMFAKFMIREPRLLKEYKALVNNQSAYDMSACIPQVEVLSSDVGTCSATVLPSFKTPRGSTIRITPREGLRHRKGVSLEKFGDRMEEVFAKYVDFANKLGMLAEIEIRNPAEAFEKAAKKAGIPRKLYKPALDDFLMYVGDDSSNAHDIYLGLCESLFYAKAEGYSEQDLCRLEDVVARCLAYDWENYQFWS